jgi:serine/threonine-protein kinase
VQSSSAHRTNDGSTGEFPKPATDAALPSEDQPTVISHRPPLPASSSNPPTVPSTPAEFVPGMRLGHFELLEYVGGGGMGRVFRALDTSLNRPVALKILSREQAADAETLMRFRNEARSAARLNHDGIIQVYFVGEDAGLPFIAFEFVEGVNVRVLVEQKGRLSLAEAVSYTLQVAEALAHAAQRNVVHRDIKPSNILITADGRSKLIDMGLARLQNADNPAGELTVSGVTLGTFDYISPEQARDPRVADVRSDIYSLGCTFFYMLTGRPPFPQGTVLQKLLQHQADEPPDLREFRPELPEEVSRVLRKMMAKDPNHRYQDATKLIMGLLVLAELAGLQRVGPGQTVWVAPREPDVSVLERHLPWLAPVAALVGIVLLLHLLWSSGGLRDGQGGIPVANAPTVRTEQRPSVLESPEMEPDEALAPETSPLPPTSPPAAAAPSKPENVPQPPSPEQGKTPASPAPHAPASVAPSAPSPAGQVDAAIAFEGSATPRLSTGLGSERLEGGLAFSPQVSGALSAAWAGPAAASPSPPPGAAKPIAPVPAVKPSDEGILLLRGNRATPERFASLGAACSAAADGETIELRYHGRRREAPLNLTHRQLTIRAGEGFQPGLVFRPAEVDSIKHTRSMITLAGNRLAISGVAVEFEVPRDVPADDWSLFQMSEGQELSLARCSLTIRNASDRQAAYHQDVAFFRLQSDLAIDGGQSSASAVPLTTLTLADCIARGEAVFLRVEKLQPVSLTWKNGLLVTTERLLMAEGGERSPLPEESIHLALQHLTAVARNGLCHLNHAEFAAHLWPLRVEPEGCIFLIGPASPLIEQTGVTDVAEALTRLAWNGSHNFYEGFTVFWNIRTLNAGAPAQLMAFNDWQAYWKAEREYLPGWNLVQWRQLPEASRPVSAHTPADYALRGNNNPAVGAGGDDHDAGMKPDQLPPLPSESDEPL